MLFLGELGKEVKEKMEKKAIIEVRNTYDGYFESAYLYLSCKVEVNDIPNAQTKFESSQRLPFYHDSDAENLIEKVVEIDKEITEEAKAKEAGYRLILDLLLNTLNKLGYKVEFTSKSDC